MKTDTIESQPTETALSQHLSKSHPSSWSPSPVPTSTKPTHDSLKACRPGSTATSATGTTPASSRQAVPTTASICT